MSKPMFKFSGACADKYEKRVHVWTADSLSFTIGRPSKCPSCGGVSHEVVVAAPELDPVEVVIMMRENGCGCICSSNAQPLFPGMYMRAAPRFAAECRRTFEAAGVDAPLIQRAAHLYNSREHC